MDQWPSPLRQWRSHLIGDILAALSSRGRDDHRFGSLEDARIFCGDFFGYYNNEHRHSGIAMHTPASVHDGTAVTIHAKRVATLHAAFLDHPERFHGRRPYPPPLPSRVWINKPLPTQDIDSSPQPHK